MRATHLATVFLRCLSVACILGALATPAFAAKPEHDAGALRCDARPSEQKDTATSAEVAKTTPDTADGKADEEEDEEEEEDETQEVDKEALRKKLQKQLRHRR